MQTALTKAIQRAGFDGVNVQNNSIENLFIVSEPEAAAAYVLASERHVTVRQYSHLVLLRATLTFVPISLTRRSFYWMLVIPSSFYTAVTPYLLRYRRRNG